jgi:hypothetical protein
MAGESKHISDQGYLTSLVGRPLVPFFDGADVVNEDLTATQCVNTLWKDTMGGR